MDIFQQLAKHIREMHFGGNWTDSNMKDQISDVSWQEATTRISTLNTIAELVFHIHYFVKGQLDALRNGHIDIHDRYSFDLPLIANQSDWDAMREKCWQDAEELANLIDQLPKEWSDKPFMDQKYGSYYHNFQGLIEHTHYHLGQLVLVKKLIRSAE